MDQAEQLRNIVRMNNKTEKTEKVARVITVTSGKGGVGKSNMSVNLAIQLRKLGKSVLIFDADFGLANIEVLFGSIPKYNLGDVIYRNKNIKEVITTGPMGIKFISGGTGIDGLGNLNKGQIETLVNNLSELDSLADIIIIDTGAGISDSVLDFVMSGSEVILVTTPEPTSITDSYSMLKAINRNSNYKRSNLQIRVAVNKVSSQNEGKALFSKLNVVVQRFLELSIEYLGAIPMDDSIFKAVMQQSPVSLKFPNSKATRAYSDIAKIIASGEEEQTVSKRGIANLFSNFIRKKT